MPMKNGIMSMKIRLFAYGNGVHEVCTPQFKDNNLFITTLKLLYPKKYSGFPQVYFTDSIT